jgi:chromosome segregation ATPase
MSDNIKRFSELSKKVYKDQAIWFMNGFWGQGVDPNEANKIWDYVQEFIRLDKMSSAPKGEQGNELDQFWSAKFLEDMDSAMTAIARKEALKKIDQDNNGKMSTIEYLVWKYNKSVEATINAPQGTSPELEAAQRQLEKLQVTMNELQVAVDELKKQEDEYNKKISDLTAKSTDTSATLVNRNKAAAELAQLKSEDPLPLRKAKITQEAAVRKVEKEMAATRVLIDQLKGKGGVAPGALWWMEREMFEADSRLPKAKQQYNHSKAFFYDPKA